MDDIKALEMLIKMKEFGITDLDLQEFKAKFQREEPVLNADELLNKLYPNELTEEELMYYATPYFDQLQAEKELMKQNIKDEVRE